MCTLCAGRSCPSGNVHFSSPLHWFVTYQGITQIAISDQGWAVTKSQNILFFRTKKVPSSNLDWDT